MPTPTTSDILDVILGSALPMAEGVTMREIKKGTGIGERQLGRWIDHEIAAGRVEVVRVRRTDRVGRVQTTWAYRFRVNGKKK